MINKKFIGKIFSSWKVIELVDKKTYRYKCQCIHCGTEREFIKYNLLKGKYKCCSKDCIQQTINLKTIKDHWSCELNGFMLNSLSQINLSKKYWFICNNNHNFKCRISDFSLEKCLGCKTNNKSESNVDSFVRLFKNSLDELGINYNEPMQNVLRIDSRAMFVHIREADRYKTIKKYFDNEKKYLHELQKLDIIREEQRTLNFEFKEIHVYSKKIDTLMNLRKELDISLGKV